MVDIQCTRCGATGNNYPTLYVAKFSLKHETGCGAKIGVPKYSDTNTKSVKVEETSFHEPTEKPKKKKAKKVKQTIIEHLS